MAKEYDVRIWRTSSSLLSDSVGVYKSLITAKKTANWWVNSGRAATAIVKDGSTVKYRKHWEQKLENSGKVLKTPKGGFIKCRGVRIRAGKLEILK